MPIDPKEGLQEHAGFLGLRNTVPSDRFGLGDLEAATNVDIDDSGRVTRRKGYSAQVVSGACKSLWSDGTTALAVRSETDLVQIQPDYSVATLRSNLAPVLDMAYTGVAGRVFYSNGVDTGVVQNGRSRSWGLVPPIGQPTASAIGGVLKAGTYQFAATFLRRDMQESGTIAAGTINIADNQGVSLASLPVSSDPDVVKVAVYFSKRNGEMLFRVGLLLPNAGAFTYQMEASMQVPLITQHLRPAPPGQIVDNLNGGRTLVARDNVLYYSEPYSLELFDLRKNFTYPSRITLVVGMNSGAYIGTADDVVWMDGTVPEKWTSTPKLSYGAIPGAVTVCSKDMVNAGAEGGRLMGEKGRLVAVFATTRGVCVGEDNGMIVNLTQERFLYPAQDKGAMLVRRHRGFVQGLVTMQGAEIADDAIPTYTPDPVVPVVTGNLLSFAGRASKPALLTGSNGVLGIAPRPIIVLVATPPQFTLGANAVDVVAVNYINTLQATITATAGRSLVVAISWYSGSTETISSVSCTGESNLTVHGSPLYVAGNSEAIQFASLANITAGGSKTIVLTLTGSVQYRQMTVFEFVGGVASNFLNAVSTASGSSANPTGSITTTADHCLIVARTSAMASASSAGVGYTLQAALNGVINGGDAIEYKLDAGTAGVVSVPFVCANNGPWGVVAAAFNVV